MEINKTFDPMAWINQENGNEKPVNKTPQVINNAAACSPFEGELAKAKAVADELLRMGANIAESYEDYLQLGFSLANGLGDQGGELYHQLCSMSTKYREADCEKKWQECLNKNDGRTTIATFYKMAQDAGVDLSAISRQFPSVPSVPSVPSFPHLEGFNEGNDGKIDNNNSYYIDNQYIINNNQLSEGTDTTISLSREGMRELRELREVREVRESQTSESEVTDEGGGQYTETFSDRLNIDDLPVLMQQLVLMRDTAEDRDKALLSSMVLLSGVMPNVFGIYHEKRVMPPLYLILDAPSGALKGVIDDFRYLVMPIEQDLQNQYRQEMDDYRDKIAQWNAMDRKQKASQREPEAPKYRSLFVAANSSSTSWQQALADNHERGIMFETEADTLTQALKQDYGNYSDALRKAFHHEQITYARRTENEHVTIGHPQLAVLLTCTPHQISLLLSGNEVENGTASRFLFYNQKGGHAWRDPFAYAAKPLSDRILEIGKPYKVLYNELLKRSQSPLQILLSHEQQVRFNDYFKTLLPEQIGLYGDNFDAFVYRLGLVTFRMAMILTVLRRYGQQPVFEPDTQALVCSDADLNTALTIVSCLINHTAHVYTNFLVRNLPESNFGVAMSAQERSFFTSLPADFTTKESREKAEGLGIPWKTAERYLGNFFSRYHIISRVSQGVYKKKQ